MKTRRAPSLEWDTDMRHRLDKTTFAATSSAPAKFLMLAALRAALRKTPQFQENAKGLMICIVKPEWIWHAKAAAGVLMGKGRGFYGDDFRRPVHIIDSAKRLSGKGTEEMAVFRPEHQALYLATSRDVVPLSLKLAADVIVDIPTPTARHVVAARKVIGGEVIDMAVAEAIARQPADVVIGLTARHSLSGFDLTSLSNINALSPRTPRLSELPGFSPVRPWVEALKRDVGDWRKNSIRWSDADRGVLLVGPPGTGKTLFASALASELGFELVATSVGEWQGSGQGHLGDMLSAMSTSFTKATSCRGAVLFVDELDAIGDRIRMRSDHTYYEGNVIGRFLELTTHALDQPGTIVVGATNYGHLIDNAILRSGRLETHIQLNLPDEEERADILSYHFDQELSAAELRKVTDNLILATPADLERLARAAKRAARVRKGVLSLHDVKAVLPAKIPIPEEALHRICVHEIGHALMAMASGAEEISVRVESHMVEGASVQDGGRVHYKMSNLALPTDKDLLTKIRTMLGGTAAEEVLFGSRSIGAGGVEGSDLDQATRLAYRFVASYGLGKGLRYQVGVDRVDETFVPAPELRTEVESILAREYRATKELLVKEKVRLMRLAAELVVDRQMRIAKS